MDIECVFELYLHDLIDFDDVDECVQSHLHTQRAKPVFRSEKGIFNLEDMLDDEVVANFRFERRHLYQLQKGLKIPDRIEVRRGCKIDGLTALCVLLRRITYPNRLSDLERMFGISISFISSVFNHMVLLLTDRFGHLLENLSNLQWLDDKKLNEYCTAVSRKGAPLDSCWAFIDGTARRICRPSVYQENYYSGHKRFHCVKYQSVLAPDGIIVSLHGAYPGRRHDAGIYAESGMQQQLKSLNSQKNKYVIYGDPAYAISDVLVSPYRAALLSQQQEKFNSEMSKVRQSVKWGFQKIALLFAFVDFHKNQKLLLQEISKTYKICAILANCHTCLYGSQTSQYFNLDPPLLEDYLSCNDYQ